MSLLIAIALAVLPTGRLATAGTQSTGAGLCTNCSTPLTADGTASGSANATSVATSAGLTTTGAGYVLAFMWSNTATGGATFSVSGAGLTWTQLLLQAEGTNSGYLAIFGAPSTGAISNQTITGSNTGSAAQQSIYVAAFSGAKGSAPYTAAATSLGEQTTDGTGALPLTVSATAGGSVVFCTYKFGSGTTGSVTADGGFTQLFQANTGSTFYVQRKTAATGGSGAVACSPTGPGFAFYIPGGIEILQGP